MPKSEFWPFSSKAVEEQNVGGESSVLQKQVLLMESEMEEMRLELAAIKRERLCSSSRPPTEPDQMFLGKDTSGIYKNVIKSQNEEDFSVKVLPLKTVSQLREELIRAKNTADEERFQREKSERKLRDLETKLNGICSRGADEVKMQFQEKLQELAPLPDLLKGAQIQLQEARQLQKLAEDSSEHLSDELNRVKEKLIAAVTNLNAEKADRKTVVEENNALKDEVDMGKKEIEELCRNIDDYKCQVLRLEEKLSQLDLRYQEKAEECARLVKDVEELREEGSRSLSRSKERAESMRRYMNTQVSELERQLIQTRAQCRTFQKERDDVRQRMQLQVNSLQENFDIAELRLRALQNQVTSLKNSYAIILSDEDEDLQKSPRLNEYLQM
ncbi:outer dense fiber protein 2-like isoform X3 [Maniola jurtina]|uniref:outer dense fiber protein 2-like isoform X3 n=1 Tax=Maniola jurtina TaxID=191418 RepID=UPI001E6886D2|nr:outer dense fiber protein 2-like isoform X3 [Maniola jurtina]